MNRQFDNDNNDEDEYYFKHKSSSPKGTKQKEPLVEPMSARELRRTRNANKRHKQENYEDTGW